MFLNTLLFIVESTNNKTTSLQKMIYYSNQGATCIGCNRQPSPGFRFIVMKYINTLGMTTIKFVYPTDGMSEYINGQV